MSRALALLAILIGLVAAPISAAVRYEVTLTPEAAAIGSAVTARALAAAYGGIVEPGEKPAVFILRIRPEAEALLRLDPRVRQLTAVTMDSADWDSGAFTYDGAGNIKSIGNDVYVYDEASRLKSATVNGSSNKQTFTYDAFGNRIATTRAAGSSICIGDTGCEMDAPVQHPALTNHFTGATYDEAGNVGTLDSTYTYTYDATGAVMSASNGTSTREYIYNADGERIATINGNNWSWTFRGPHNEVLREYTSTGTNGASNWTWTRDHIWRGSSPLAVETPTGTFHLHLDHLGTPRVVTNANGQKVGLHDYYAFGTELLPTMTESPADNFRFTGHEWDDLGGDIHSLEYMHARYYSAALGRFLSVDPVLGKPEQPQSWNRYAYVLNNPINRIDPDGRCFWDACLLEGAAAAFALTSGSAATLQAARAHPGKTNADEVKRAVGVNVAIIKGLTKIFLGTLPGRQPTTGVNPSAPIETEPTKGVNPSAPIQSQVVNTSQGPVTIPSDYGSRPADNGKGTVYQAPGATGNADMIRVMDATTRYPTGYVVIHNSQGQPVTIDGKPGSRPETHLPIEEQKPQ